MMKRGALSRGRIVVCIFVVCATLQIVGAVAQPVLAKTKRLTWDVIGLDSNNLTAGPDTFVIGQRVCNTGDLDATNVEAALLWQTANANIDVAPGSPSTISIGTLAPAECYDAYFNIRVARVTASRNSTRQYLVSFSADGLADIASPIDAANYNEVYVESLISQNRNSIDSIVGPATVYQGATYSYTLNASTATQGYQQLQSFINFPNNIFRIVEVSATYSQDNAGTDNDTVYADACGWVHDPEDPDYFTNGTNDACRVSGREGGDISLDYTIEIIGTGSATVTALIADFSGSSFHYNTDYGRDILAITALAAPVISVSDVSVVEGNSGSNFAVFTVSLDAPRPDAAVQFSYSTADGTAISGRDYTASTGTGTIAAGSLSTTVSVPVTTETLYEADETFSLAVSEPVNASIGDGSAEGLITNDDGPPVISITDTSITEGGSLVFTLNLSGPSGFATTGTVTTETGTAGAADFTAGTINFAFPAGTTTTTVTVPTTSDSLAESDENMRLVVSSIDGGLATGLDNFGTGTIVDDDVALAPTVTLGDATAMEGDNLVFDITLSNPSATDITLTLAATGVSASTDDFDGTPVQVTIPAGTTTITAAIPTNTDDIEETDETLTLSVASVDAGSLSDTSDTGTGTIRDAEQSILVAVQGICVRDAPYLEYEITTVNFTPVNGATMEWIGSDGSVVQTLADQPLARTRILWPGAAVDATGNGIAWPGWEQRDGDWFQIPSLVRPTAEVRVSVNPTETVSVTYPPSTPQCATDPPGAQSAGPGGAYAIPTMREWGLAVLSLLVIAVVAHRRRVLDTLSNS